MSKKSFIAYSTSDIAIAAHPNYPRCATVFHEISTLPSGRTVHRWTHSRRTVYSLFGCSASYRLQQYAVACARTFAAIPDYEILSASQYARSHNISHVTAKKRLVEESKKLNSNVMQISAKYFAVFNDNIAREFIERVMTAFYSEARPRKNGGMEINGMTLPQILRKLQYLKEVVLRQHNFAAYYTSIEKILTQPIISFLLRHSILRKINVDFMFSKTSLLYYSFSL